MYKCDCCGRVLKKKISLHGYILCSKHMHQLSKYDKFLDNISRTAKDLNDYTIDGDITKIHCYNQKNEYVDSFIIDTSCLNIVKYHKWRLSHGYPRTGFGSNQHTVSYYLMNPKPGMVVDHINGNPLDNRMCNLRVCKQFENTLNKIKTFRGNSCLIGVWVDKRKKYTRYIAEIRVSNKKLYLGNYFSIEEAMYARFIGELICFGEYRNHNSDTEKFAVFDNILIYDRFRIMQHVANKYIKVFLCA